MHFSKTYSQLLESLPPELQENVIQYRQLKKIIKQTVNELSSFGLNPSFLHELFQRRGDQLVAASLYRPQDLSTSTSPSTGGRVPGSATPSVTSGHGFPKVVYEFSEDSKVGAQLRISVESMEDLNTILCHGTKERDVEEQSEADTSEQITGPSRNVELDSYALSENSLSWSLQKADFEHPYIQANGDGLSDVGTLTRPQTPLCKAGVFEVVIPLVSDSEFFELLYTTLEHMSIQLKSVEGAFMEALKVLSRTIGDTARPVSSSHSAFGRSFHALSPLKDHAGAVHVQRCDLSKTDLYAWREIFQLYTEAEVFESIRERDRGERSVEDCERRLQLFANQVSQRGLATLSKFKSKKSRHAMETFLQLNTLILNIKKFQLTNSEATRKILKKHARRTALPPPSEASSHSPPQFVLRPQVQTSSLPRVLVQAIGETLLPIIPHLEDYSCLICTNIAFKPIRLDCGHLFCVRCLVKMQKRGQGDCPMCRAPSVLVANRSNVDWALMNFMQDWFPLEARDKLKANEEEANAEELELARLRLDSDTCVIM